MHSVTAVKKVNVLTVFPTDIGKDLPSGRCVHYLRLQKCSKTRAVYALLKAINKKALNRSFELRMNSFQRAPDRNPFFKISRRLLPITEDKICAKLHRGGKNIPIVQNHVALVESVSNAWTTVGNFALQRGTNALRPDFSPQILRGEMLLLWHSPS